MERRELTAKMLAAKAGISVNTLNMYIGYREATPSAEVAVKLARALGVTVEYLIDGATPRPPFSKDFVADIAADSAAAEKPVLSAFDLVVEEVRKTPAESLPSLLQLIVKFNKGQDIN